LNHIILLTTSYVRVHPTERYPYGAISALTTYIKESSFSLFSLFCCLASLLRSIGMDKIKNAAALVPAGLFIYFGCETIYEALMAALFPAAEAVAAASHHGSGLYSFLVSSSE
jgi:hypothetical protein